MAEYKKKKIVDKEVQTNGFEKRSEEFQDNVSDRGEMYEMIHDLSEKATEKAFDKEGVERVEKYAGVYATGKPYGAGVQKGKYDVRFSSQVKSAYQKQTIFGTKRMETEITSDFDAENDLLTVHYDGTEKAVFRGHLDNEDPMGYMINDKITISTKDEKKLKKELEKFFNKCAVKEVKYLIKTNIGIDDRMETSMAGSVVENANINKMGLNDLLNSSPEDIVNFFEKKLQESIDGGIKNIDPEGEEVKGTEDFHPEDVIDANTQGNLLFDDEISEEDAGNYQAFVDALVAKDFPGKTFGDLEKNEKSKLFLDVEKMWTSKDEKEAMISEGVSNNLTGPLAYATYVTVNNNRLEAMQHIGSLNESELEEMTTAGAPGAPGTAGDFHYQSPNFLKNFDDTNYAKGKKKRPSIKKAKNEGDSFWTTVDVEDLSDTHPLGMPGVKLGSKEELKNSTPGGGGAKNTKFIKKLQEGRTHDVTKRQFFDESDNVEQGINKRYLVKKELSESDLKNKWSKLSNFVSESTINKEALTDSDKKMLSECACSDMESEESKEYTYLNGDVVSREEAERIMNADYEEENADIEAMAKMENLVDVQRPGSFVVLRISESDLMNENKKFVLDHNTGNFVEHPACENVGLISENRELVFDLKSRSYIPNPKFRK